MDNIALIVKIILLWNCDILHLKKIVHFMQYDTMIAKIMQFHNKKSIVGKIMYSQDSNGMAEHEYQISNFD